MIVILCILLYGLLIGVSWSLMKIFEIGIVEIRKGFYDEKIEYGYTLAIVGSIFWFVGIPIVLGILLVNKLFDKKQEDEE